MPINRVPPLKNDPAEGYEEDFDPNADAANVRGIVVQSDSSSDTAVQVTRDASNNLVLIDPIAGPHTLSSLLTGGSGITAAQHKTLLQLIHFIDEGPAEGFATGATKTITGTVFPSSILWKRADATKLVEQNISWAAAKPVIIQWKMYDVDGTTVLATVTDTISYSGAFETGRTRAIV